MGSALVVLALALTALPAAPFADEVEECTVPVRVKPWADVFVDGELAGAGIMKIDLSLAPGAHVISFRNPAAHDVDRAIAFDACEAVPALAVQLSRRPALLTVDSNVDDADVAVCGPAASARSTAASPIPVSLPAGVSDVEVRVSRRGYATVVKRVRLSPGKRTSVRVILPED